MFTLYKVNNQKASHVRGFWQDDNNKLYADNVHIEHYKRSEALKEAIKALFEAGEKAVFYKDENKSFILSHDDTKQAFNYRLRLHRQKLSIREFKALLRVFGGVTVHKLRNRYIIEVYHN